jgi:hypothetical protein
MRQALKNYRAASPLPASAEGRVLKRQVAAECERLEDRRLLSATAVAADGLTLDEQLKVTFTANLGSFVTLAPGTHLRASIKWGDGKHSKGVLKADGVVGLDEINFEVDGTHAYRRAGTYPITITVYQDGATPTTVVRIVSSFSATAIVAPSRTTLLNGTVSGTYSLAPVPVDVGADYVLSGSGTAGRLGAVTAQGNVGLPGLIATGNASGTLTLTTAGTSAATPGSVTLKLTGPTEKGFGPFPSTLSYTITSGTGAFASASGSGSIAATLSGVGQFTFKITSLVTPTLASNG